MFSATDVANFKEMPKTLIYENWTYLFVYWKVQKPLKSNTIWNMNWWMF